MYSKPLSLPKNVAERVDIPKLKPASASRGGDTVATTNRAKRNLFDTFKSHKTFTPGTSKTWGLFGSNGDDIREGRFPLKRYKSCQLERPVKSPDIFSTPQKSQPDTHLPANVLKFFEQGYNAELGAKLFEQDTNLDHLVSPSLLLTPPFKQLHQSILKNPCTPSNQADKTSNFESSPLLIKSATKSVSFVEERSSRFSPERSLDQTAPLPKPNFFGGKYTAPKSPSKHRNNLLDDINNRNATVVFETPSPKNSFKKLLTEVKYFSSKSKSRMIKQCFRQIEETSPLPITTNLTQNLDPTIGINFLNHDYDDDVNIDFTDKTVGCLSSPVFKGKYVRLNNLNLRSRDHDLFETVNRNEIRACANVGPSTRETVAVPLRKIALQSYVIKNAAPNLVLVSSADTNVSVYRKKKSNSKEQNQMSFMDHLGNNDQGNAHDTGTLSYTTTNRCDVIDQEKIRASLPHTSTEDEKVDAKLDFPLYSIISAAGLTPQKPAEGCADTQVGKIFPGKKPIKLILRKV
ncbi:unnamed protein product [Gordionus sp. m RMFG-2023]